jgi:hypothetical protein
VLATALKITNNKEQRFKKKKRSGFAAPSTEETSSKLLNEEFQRIPKGGRKHSIRYRSSGTANLRSEISHINLLLQKATQSLWDCENPPNCG